MPTSPQVLNMLLFRIYRNDSDKSATDFDMGYIEFVVDKRTISSRDNPRLLNMIYVSIVDLIDGLLQLKNGGKRYEFIGADSSFTLRFARNKQGIHVLHGKDKYGPISLLQLLAAIDSGIDVFLAAPRNELPAGSSMYDDFNTCRSALKKALA